MAYTGKTTSRQREEHPRGPRAEKLRPRARTGSPHDDHEPERRERLVGSGPPLRLTESLHGLLRTSGGSGDLARVQGPVPEGHLPRPEVSVVPGGLDRNPGRRVDHDWPPHDHPRGLLVVPGDDRALLRAVRTYGLRRLQGEPGRGLSLPFGCGPG